MHGLQIEKMYANRVHDFLLELFNFINRTESGFFVGNF